MDNISLIGALGIDNESWTWVNRFKQNKIGLVTATPFEMTTGPCLK
jgi:hypothetical protein